jgi:hypothetical protein
MPRIKTAPHPTKSAAPKTIPSFDVLSQLLLPYQQRWIADRSRLKLSEKSRRIGLSWGDALESALTAAISKEDGGMDCYYLGFNKEMSETYIQDCANWARGLNLLAGEVQQSVLKDEDKDILVFRIRFASGHKVMALSSKPTNLRSRKGRIVLDEFAFHDNPEQLLKAAMATLVWGGKVAIISTHNGVASKFYELCEMARTGENDWALHRTTLDDARVDGLYQRICQVQGVPWSQIAENEWRDQLFRDYGATAQEELMCVPMESTNCLFDMDAIAKCSIGKWEAPKDKGLYFISVDPNFGAMNNDYYVAQVWDVGSLPISLVFEYRNNGNGSEYHDEQLDALIDTYDPLMLVFERNGGGLPMAERVQKRREDLRVELVNTGHLSKIINTDRLAQMIEQGEIMFPKNWKGIHEMRRFSRMSREALSGHDDTIMCAAVGMALVGEVLIMAGEMRGLDWMRSV